MDLKQGWTAFAERRWLWSFTILFCALNLFAMPALLVLGAALFHARGDGAAAIGIVMSAGGFGVLLGGLAAMLAAIATAPLGFVLAGFAWRMIGAETGLLLSAIILIVFCALALAVPELRRFTHDLAQPEASA